MTTWSAVPRRLVQVVRGQHDGDAVARSSSTHVAHHQAGLGVQPGGRLVEEHHARAADQRGGERQPLALRRRTAGARSCAANAVMPSRSAQGADVERVRACIRGELAQHGQRRARRSAGRRPAASPRRPARCVGRRGRVVAEHPDAARRPAAAAHRSTRPCGLAGAVRAEQRGDLDPPRRQRHAVEARPWRR